MIQAKTRPDLLPKPGAPRREEMSTIPVKNTLLHLNSQNLALAAKNSVHSGAPGFHLSPVPVKQAAGRLTASPQLTQEGKAQLDSLLQKSSKLAPDTAKNHPATQPLKLAPLVLSKDVQKRAQKTKCSRDVAKLKAKTCVHREKLSSTALKNPSNPPVKCLDDVVCNGTQAPLFPKINPNLPHVKAKASTGPNLTDEDNGGKRRLRLTRGQCLEVDEAKSKVTTTSSPALCSDEDKRAKGVRSRVQLQDTAQRGNPQSGKGIRELPVVLQENARVKKSSGEDRKPRSVGGAPKSPRDGPSAPEGEKASPASWRLKRKKALLTNHNKTVTLEQLQL
ncbi:uncharacterized protein [Eucyclogobius newberryi]|uniref:uncharacterized protein n=1 Tax=Eucyclogobius newberryi TaxID=166745 RepID=UPI003B59299F